MFVTPAKPVQSQMTCSKVSRCSASTCSQTLPVSACEHSLLAHKFVNMQASRGTAPHHLLPIHLLTVPDHRHPHQALVCHLELLLPFLPSLAADTTLPRDSSRLVPVLGCMVRLFPCLHPGSPWVIVQALMPCHCLIIAHG